jgi:hypothetical protein
MNGREKPHMHTLQPLGPGFSSHHLLNQNRIELPLNPAVPLRQNRGHKCAELFNLPLFDIV